MWRVVVDVFHDNVDLCPLVDVRRSAAVPDFDVHGVETLLLSVQSSNRCYETIIVHLKDSKKVKID